MNLLKKPFGSSHHVFPDHLKFCPYLGSKLANEKEIHKNIVKVNLSVNKSQKKISASHYGNLDAF